MGWEVIFAPRSERDLAKIVTYIAQDDPDAAIRFGETLITKAPLAKCKKTATNAVALQFHYAPHFLPAQNPGSASEN